MKNPSEHHSKLPAMLALAYGAGDGAYAWRKKDLPAVLDTLEAEGLAVLGGEIWGIRDAVILGAVPTRCGGTRILAWSAPVKNPETRWPDYVTCCAQHAREAIRRLQAEKEVTPAFRDRLFYHLHFFDADEFQRQTKNTGA